MIHKHNLMIPHETSNRPPMLYMKQLNPKSYRRTVGQ